MIRRYDHAVDGEFLHGLLSGPWSENFSRVREQVVEHPSAELNLTVAVDTFYEGVCLAWAFENDRALTQLRQLLSSHIAETLTRFPNDRIQTNSSYRSFSRAGAGLDPTVIVRYAEVLRDRQRYVVGSGGITIDPHGYADALLDGLIGLVLGQLGVAQKVSITLDDHLRHPRTPPTVAHRGLAHAIDAVARRDQAALDDAVDYVVERHIHDATPTRGRPAGPTTLVHPELSLICRTAVWHGMTWPPGQTTPYVMTSTDAIAAPMMT